MYRVLLIRESRTEHAKMVRKLTGTNDFRDKRIDLLGGGIIPCIGTTLTTDNLLTQCYE